MSNAIRDEQHQFWNKVQGPKWVRLQERIDRTMNPISEAAIDRLAVQPGEHVLDVGCGYGSTSLALAEQAGAGGHVTGADISRPMLTLARERAEAAGAPITIIEADAQTHAFDASSFDCLFSRFGVMFFADFEAAFANLLGAVKPGGRMVFACWRARRDNPWAMTAVQIAKPYLDLPPRPEQGDPGQFAFEDETFARRILEKAGWAQIEFDRFDADLDIGGNLEETTDFLLQMGPVAAPFAEASEETKSAISRELGSVLEQYEGGGRYRLASGTWIVSARKP